MDASLYQMDLLKTLNDKLTSSDRINRSFLKISGNAYYYYDFAKNYFEATGDWLGLTGLNIRELSDTDLLIDCVRDSDEESMRLLMDAEHSGDEHVTRQICLKDGKTWLEGTVFVSYNPDGTPSEKYFCIQDISQVKSQTDELVYMAYYDSLTGLYNRNYFIKCLQDMITKAEREGAQISLCMMDIDGFKRVNDSIGLILGDELIQNIGMFLREFTNDKTIVGRFGADVFLVAIYDPCGANTVENIHKQIQERLKSPFVLSNHDEILISMSCGVAEYPDGGESGFVLIKNAEVAMFKTKEISRGGISFFDQIMLDEFLGSVSMEHKLRSAIENEDFTLYYQPQFDSSTGMLRGCEALIRWVEKDGSIISPGIFIPLAEKSGGIISIGNWVLREAISTLAAWERQYDFDGILSINLSAVQLKKDNFDGNIIKLLEEFNVNPENIELEITESVFMDDFSQVVEKLKYLRNLGIRISLDDFGTGFSSLSYLKDLPIDTLKIDKSFVDSVISDYSTGIITESVVNMVKRLGLSTVAEGVENEQQYEWLRGINCDTIQGFLLGKPMPRSDFEMLLYKELKNTKGV